MEESWGMKEFKDCGVEDGRESKSLALMADRLLEHPELAFSSAVGSGLRRAAWRIFSKEEVDVSCGHYRQTAHRCQDYDLVLVSQDTTDLSYPTHHATEGLGDLGGGRGGVNLGLSLHSALAMSAAGLPLGLVGQKLWAPAATGRPEHHRHYPLEEKENYCWVEALQWVEQYLSGVKQVVMVSDRDSDFYEYFSSPRPANVDLLFRVHHLHRYVYCRGGADAARGGRLYRCRSGVRLSAQGKEAQGADGPARGELGAGGLPARLGQKRGAGGLVAGKSRGSLASCGRGADSMVSAHYDQSRGPGYCSSHARLLPQALGDRAVAPGAQGWLESGTTTV